MLFQLIEGHAVWLSHTNPAASIVLRCSGMCGCVVKAVLRCAGCLCMSNCIHVYGRPTGRPAPVTSYARQGGQRTLAPACTIMGSVLEPCLESEYSLISTPAAVAAAAARMTDVTTSEGTASHTWVGTIATESRWSAGQAAQSGVSAALAVQGKSVCSRDGHCAAASVCHCVGHSALTVEPNCDGHTHANGTCSAQVDRVSHTRTSANCWKVQPAACLTFHNSRKTRPEQLQRSCCMQLDWEVG